MNNYTKYIETILLEDFGKIAESKGLETFFTNKEIENYGKEKRLRSLAARYLIKEKLLEIADNRLGYHDIEILNERNGKPVITIKKYYSEKNVHISISHTRVRATVLVVLEGVAGDR